MPRRISQRLLPALSLISAATITPAFAQTYRFEAEKGELHGVVISTDDPGSTGAGYVTGFDNGDDRLVVHANVPEGMYELWIRYESPSGFKKYGVQVDKERGEGGFDRSMQGFAVDRAGIFKISAGGAMLEIHSGWGHFNIDWLELRPAAIRTLRPVAPTLSDSHATAVTQFLMTYLTSVYGKQTLSGHQEPLSEAYLQASGGLKPAISGIDLMDYSPSRRERGADPGDATERMIQWARETGGIVTVSWHWNAPTDLIDKAGGQEWWRGFNSKATTFDLQAAMARGDSPGHKLLLRDIDAIAVELKKFADAGVPVLWRPLHEAQGKWFWWGAKGPAPFVALWRLLHERLTNVHQLHNLIWVFTSAPADGKFADWYPGDDVTDVVGIDVYGDPTWTMSRPWLDLLDRFDGAKLIALSETGALPRADLSAERGVRWSWFLTWSTGRITGKDMTPGLHAVLSHDEVVSLDELPSTPWRAAARQRIGPLIEDERR